mmetsp:Transcript_94741/g.230171  ORF Transcript_94741/g.230171 Transcript_94741/m.230171 type:complete len:230 (-) Transcript_94741:3-692(-)
MPWPPQVRRCPRQRSPLRARPEARVADDVLLEVGVPLLARQVPARRLAEAPQPAPAADELAVLATRLDRVHVLHVELRHRLDGVLRCGGRLRPLHAAGWQQLGVQIAALQGLVNLGQRAGGSLHASVRAATEPGPKQGKVHRGGLVQPLAEAAAGGRSPRLRRQSGQVGRRRQEGRREADEGDGCRGREEQGRCGAAAAARRPLAVRVHGRALQRNEGAGAAEASAELA